ncbi:MAG TPA: hypothetical protein DHV95_02105, partial [Faecalibacterium sp.]|nr:hypothetical protein [Faecalibacterium sp.]
MLFTVMFVLVLGVIIVTLVRNVSQWHKNNNSPRLTVQATITSTPSPTRSAPIW